VADIYDALTAHDRPYKPPMPHERAASILREQAKESFLNLDVVDLFLNRKLYLVKD
jgi:HD-GYP domain-containing protein (c-di-GMP phosphodiesterase class II)